MNADNGVVDNGVVDNRTVENITVENIANESVGEFFSNDKLVEARDKTLEVILQAAKQIKPGMLESEAKTLVADIQTKLGAPKSWHPPQIRFGINSTLPFGKVGEPGVVLKPNDIYFIDIGPIFDGHEGDVGRPFAVGNDPEMQRCCLDAEKIWQEVCDHWRAKNVTGEELYCFAETRASARGWLLVLEKANGHRIADFPHAARFRNSVNTLKQTPLALRWILEIQIQHPSKTYGAFYEDLLV